MPANCSPSQNEDDQHIEVKVHITVQARTSNKAICISNGDPSLDEGPFGVWPTSSRDEMSKAL